MFEFFLVVIRFLNENRIPYMLTGGVAMSIYIVPRATRDMDVVVAIGSDDADRIVQGFGENYYCDKDAILNAVRRESLFNIIDSGSGAKADFIVLKSTAYQQTAFGRRQVLDFMGTPVYAISPEDLILAKLQWIQDHQSAIQLQDIRNLLELDTLDRAYIAQWVNELKLATFDLPL